MNNGLKGTKFEWWYFHFLSDYSFTFIIHPNNMYGLNNSAYMSLSISYLDGTTKHLKKHLEKNFIKCKTSLDYSDKSLFIKEDENRIIIRAQFEGLFFSGQIKKNSKPIVFKENALMLEDLDTGKSNHWFIVIPQGSFTGKIEENSTIVQLKGNAYHDHNWGDLLIQESYTKWAWGNVQFIDGSLTYYCLISKQAKIHKYLFLKYRSKTFVLTDFTDINLFSMESVEKIALTFMCEIGDVLLEVREIKIFREHEVDTGKITIQYKRAEIKAELLLHKRKYLAHGINELISIIER